MSTTQPVVLPTFAEVRAMDAFDAWRLGEGLRADLTLHSGDFWECRACSLLALIDGRRA